MWLLAALLAAQHCGGPCEVPRGADPVDGGRFSLTAGPEKGNWRYLFNWVWTEDGNPLHRVEGTLGDEPCVSFGYRRMFASPAGNGFLVTGNGYTKAEAPPLFVFCDPRGSRLLEVPLPEDQRTAGPCPNCDCAGVLYVFEEDPHLSPSGGWVELRTNRLHGFYLPLGVPVDDRAAFERILGEHAEAVDGIGALVRALDDDDPDARARAADGLVAAGYAAFPALHDALAKPPSEEVRELAGRILSQLKPREGYEAVLRNGALLEALSEFPAEPVARAARTLRIHEAMKRVRADGPGAAVGVFQNGKPVFLQGYGLADLESKRPIDAKTVFELASVTKAFTAMGIQILAERGALKIDDDARSVLPELPVFDAKRPIRVRDLLWHTSGLPDYLDLIEGDDWTSERVLKRLAEEPLDFPTGTKFEYSNSNYLLLGLVIERLAKKPYREFMAESIFGPYEMKSAAVFDDPARKIPDVATGYRREGDSWERSESDLAVVGDGGVRVSLEDWAGWERMLREKGSFESGTLDDGTEIGYGFGWAVGDGVVDHSGGWYGASTYVVRHIKRGLTVVVLSNDEDFPAAETGERIAELFPE